MKVSAVWIAKNEASCIARSINSIKAVADELVVVDTGSTDATKEESIKAGAMVKQFEWCKDFAAARNYALSQTSGDIVFFLDADEWFEPALKAEDKETLIKKFSDSSVFSLKIRRTDIDPGLGSVISVGESIRVFRKNAVTYKGNIHERIYPTNKNCVMCAVSPQWNINHDGYSQAVSTQKRLRNINLLEHAVEDTVQEKEKALYHVYLVRELFFIERKKAFSSLSWLLDHPNETKNILQLMPEIGKTLLLDGIVLAKEEKADSKKIWDVMVANGQKAYENDPISYILPLYYKLHFDKNESELLQELPNVIQSAEEARKGKTADMGDYFRGLIDLYEAGAIAAWRKGDKELTFDYAAKALSQEVTVYRKKAVKLLYNCMRGLPLEDTVVFLEKVVGADKRGLREALIRHGRCEGFTDIYTYWMKKELDEGVATKGDFWYLMIVLGKYEEALQMALAAKDTTDKNLVQYTMYLAILCAENHEWLMKYKNELGEYAPVLELFFSGDSAASISFGVVVSSYEAIAFAKGRELANKLLKACKGLEEKCFLVQSAYYMDNGLYRELLEDSSGFIVADAGATTHIRLAECALHCMQHEKAMAHLQVALKKGENSEEWWDILEAIVQSTEDEAILKQTTDLKNLAGNTRYQ